MSKPSAKNLAARFGNGHLDMVSATQISGWAWDPEASDGPVMVEILDGGERLATIEANLFRPDVRDAGLGDGYCGFILSFSASLLPKSRHLISVRRLRDGAELTGSPIELVREDGGLDDAAQQHVATLCRNEVDSARRPADLDRALSFVVAQLGTLLQRRAELGTEPAAPDLGPLSELIDAATPAQWVQGASIALSTRYRPLRLPLSGAPLVSVIIPVHGKFQLTYDCIDAIAKALPDAPIEVIMVDDCSADETLLAPLVFGGSVQVVRNDTNLGFVKSCNRGASLARGEFLFFLNNDTLVRPGWLDALVKTFEQVPRVGVVGSKLLFGDGSLQEFGGIVWRMGDAWNWGRHRDPAEPRFCFLRDADYVSGAALMIRKGLFDELGGFDTHFAPAYYEDTDLCFRVRQAGWRVVVQPQSVVVHLEGLTSGTSVTGGGMKKYQAVNHRKFYERWKDALASHGFNSNQPDIEVERTVRKRALFIDDVVPTPDQDAGSNAAMQHIRSLIRLGYKVTFIPADNMAQIYPYTEALQAIGVECIYHPFFWSVEEYLRKNQMPIDVVYLHRFTNGTKYAGMLRRHQPQARILYNVADLHHLRMEREARHTDNAALAQRAAEVRQVELSVIQSVDATIVHSSVERALLAEATPQSRVHVVPWTYPLRPVKTDARQRQGVVFVGGFRHTPNVDAARWLVEEIMPLVWASAPDVQVSLVGSYMTDEVRRLAGPRVWTMGYVPDVQAMYEQCLLSVAPLRYGAGVKGKVLEALAAGLPCVMTPCAAEGIPVDGPLGELVAEDPAHFAAKILALHADRALAERLAQAGLAMIADHCSAEVVDAAIAAAIEPSPAAAA
ncbi:glycosyltransferase [Ideonella sp. 4Y11]|uniref:Glycosyltransferase n=1 Tax=Ideonella aquatica TaxID=2824119 RepID=A0A941BKJ4_9BURK|nr:glycosyltransferase [Ideonella aquatica]MBQ0959968.1 glycosyltransferase [Ideonella aquatica]